MRIVKGPGIAIPQALAGEHMKTALLIALAFTLLAGSGCRNVTSLYVPPPDPWADRCEGEGCEDLVIFKVDEALYRGSQPTPEQFKALRNMEINTVVNLRRTHSDEEVAETLGMKYISIPIPAWDADERHIVEFLKVMRDRANHPVYVYCQFGGDRSGMIAAMYRVVVQNWEKEEAIREMSQGGYYFHPLWQNLIEDVREIDVQRVRGLSGISVSKTLMESSLR